MAKNATNSQQYRQLLRKHSRQIRSETSDPSLSKETVLNINTFLESRKFEINELIKSQLSTKLASSSRIFQRLPRKLRRRTASHNVKRIPKRLRNRAIKEMSKNENSFKITKKRLSSRQIYKLRTVKSLLKLSSRTNLLKLNSVESNLKLGKLKIRQRINNINKLLQNEANFKKLNNSNGSQDVSSTNELSKKPFGKLKYLKRQKEFNWLTSHIWHAKRSHMIKRWGFQIPYKPTQKCYRLTHRNFNFSGGICWDKSFINTLILESEDKDSLKNLIKLISKNENLGMKTFGNGCINDLFFYKNNEILGKVTIIAFNLEKKLKILLRIHPSIYEEIFNYLLEIKSGGIYLIDNRYAIGSIDITGPNSLKALSTILKPISNESIEYDLFNKLSNESSITLPNKLIFSLNVKDPRIANRFKSNVKVENINDVLIDIKINKKNLNEEIIDSLLTSEGRTKSYENQLSLKEIARFKKLNTNLKSNEIPILIYKNNDIFTVVLPWYWTLPVWYQLNHIAHINHGGLFQSHQFNFERNQLFFPIDYPFTKTGYLENLLNSSIKKSKWLKKPNSKKLQYNKLKIHKNEEFIEFEKNEIGDPFSCDWRYLQLLKYALNKLNNNDGALRTSAWDSKQERKIEQLHDVYEFIKDSIKNDEELKLLEREEFLPIKLHDEEIKPNIPNSTNEPLSVIPISVELPFNGSLDSNARIYSISEEDLNIWLKSKDSIKATGKKNNEIKPPVPHSSRLLGFITSGSYNLGKGYSTGVGAIDARYFYEKTNKYLAVRNVGEDTARLCIWNRI